MSALARTCSGVPRRSERSLASARPTSSRSAQGPAGLSFPRPSSAGLCVGPYPIHPSGCTTKNDALLTFWRASGRPSGALTPRAVSLSDIPQHDDAPTLPVRTPGRRHAGTCAVMPMTGPAVSADERGQSVARDPTSTQSRWPKGVLGRGVRATTRPQQRRRRP